MYQEVKNLNNMEDYELVCKCLEGDCSYFEEIVSRYKKLVYSIIYSKIRNRDEAEDLSQEVFLRIFKSLNKYNPEFRFSTWTASITANLCLDRLRKKKLDTVAIDEVDYMIEDDESPEYKYINAEKSELIKEAVENLPEKYRQPVILYHEKGLSYEEIMETMNEPMSIVKNRLYRARQLLRCQLEPVRKEEAL